jgi:hypothetical protein
MQATAGHTTALSTEALGLDRSEIKLDFCYTPQAENCPRWRHPLPLLQADCSRCSTSCPTIASCSLILQLFMQQDKIAT